MMTLSEFSSAAQSCFSRFDRRLLFRHQAATAYAHLVQLSRTQFRIKPCRPDSAGMTVFAIGAMLMRHRVRDSNELVVIPRRCITRP